MYFFLSETKINILRIDRLRFTLDFSDYFCIDCVGRAGGLALFWKMGVELEVVFANKNVVVSLVYSDPPNNPWLLITVHDPPYLIKRKKFWELIEDIVNGFSSQWLLIGDLNSISVSSEKCGGSSKGGRSSKSFIDFSANVGAIDLRFSDPKFTWSNRRSG